MIYLCLHSLYPYNSDFLISGISALYCFNTDDNKCRIISPEEYDKIKNLLSSTPKYENTYGVGTYFKYKYFYGNKYPAVKWCMNYDIGEVCFESGFLFDCDECYPYFYVSITNCPSQICRFGVKYDKLGNRNWKNLSNLCIMHSMPVELMKNLIDDCSLFKYLLGSLTVVFYDICSFYSFGYHIVTKDIEMQYN